MVSCHKVFHFANQGILFCQCYCPVELTQTVKITHVRWCHYSYFMMRNNLIPKYKQLLNFGVLHNFSIDSIRSLDFLFRNTSTHTTTHYQIMIPLKCTLKKILKEQRSSCSFECVQQSSSFKWILFIISQFSGINMWIAPS